MVLTSPARISSIPDRHTKNLGWWLGRWFVEKWDDDQTDTFCLKQIKQHVHHRSHNLITVQANTTECTSGDNVCLRLLCTMRNNKQNCCVLSERCTQVLLMRCMDPVFKTQPRSFRDRVKIFSDENANGQRTVQLYSLKQVPGIHAVLQPASCCVFMPCD